MKKPAEEIRKITVNLPASLIDSVLLSTGQGPTELLMDLLKREKNRLAWQKFKELRGKVDFDLTYQELKEMRD